MNPASTSLTGYGAALRPPRHIAIIMDGNGRWAQNRGFGRTWGHREGAKRVDEITTECCKLGVEFLTLYAFSTENWNRPTYEVNMLMRLLVQHLRNMDKKLLKNEVSLLAQGSLERLPRFVQTELNRVIRQTQRPDPKLYLTLCLSYGGRQEIIDAVKRVIEKVQSGEMSPSQITEETFRENLYRPDVPDPDLLIRTGGECRVSNFLLWEIAYSEFVVVDELWPEFGPAALHAAIGEFNRRERRFGKTSAQVRPAAPEKTAELTL